jgi:hypothetical protein
MSPVKSVKDVSGLYPPIPDPRSPIPDLEQLADRAEIEIEFLG